MESLDSYVQKDFDNLVKELRWLYDGDRRKAESHIGDIADFTRSWQEEDIPNLETFKKYHREYIEVAGHLRLLAILRKRPTIKGFGKA